MEGTGFTRRKVWHHVAGIVISLVLLAFVVVACVALSGWMNRSVETYWGGSGRAQQLGTVGQYFDAGSAVFSGIALLLVIGTTVMQRKELAMQRDALSKSHRELQRSAEADLRRLHMELIKMAIDDASLAEVLGQYRSDVPHERIRQYLYANLIFSHLFLNHKLEVHSDEESLGYLRSIADSAIFREYWRESLPSRTPLAEGSAEHAFAKLVNQVIYESPGTSETGGREHTSNE
ncbi:DUF6082 family protein [Streptacidiphilus carbonis]|uniref:DUF6082 family protein n=1 Tax=Streptacidiphilus carbonis TaxID=105422 RepID=UPI0006932D0C|nr:DUF6082 family protein [Streptacidiphilus carbonis]